MLVAAARIDDTAMERFARYVLGDVEALRKTHPVLDGVTSEAMPHDGIAIPLHPGVRRFLCPTGVAPVTGFRNIARTFAHRRAGHPGDGVAPLLVGCQTVGGQTAEKPLSDPKEVVDRAPRELAKKGVELLRKGEYEKAGEVFNLALKLDISNSYLQFLNGLTYHLRAIKGDSTLFAMAQEGYELAIKFDRTNWLAHYHLGLLHLDRREFAAAKESFSEAVLLKSGDRNGLYNLALSAYYDHDPVTADGALHRLRAIAPEDGRVLRASAPGRRGVGRRRGGQAVSRCGRAGGRPSQRRLCRRAGR